MGYALSENLEAIPVKIALKLIKSVREQYFIFDQKVNIEFEQLIPDLICTGHVVMYDRVIVLIIHTGIFPIVIRRFRLYISRFAFAGIRILN